MRPDADRRGGATGGRREGPAGRQALVSPTGPYASTSPSDAATALRSFPRRFRAVLRPIDDDQVEAWAEQVGPTGTSAADHLVQAARGITVLHQALRQALHAPQPPTLAPAVLDESARAFDTVVPTSVDDELHLLAEEAEAMATTIGDAPASAWAKRATVAGGGGELTTLEIAREAVRTGVDHLRAAQEAFEHARRDAGG